MGTSFMDQHLCLHQVPVFINYHRQAILGPNVFSAQGYSPFTITPTAGVAGNYYIEFNKSDPNTISNNTEIGFGIFDITVVIQLH
jgi:hypothetical protein